MKKLIILIALFTLIISCKKEDRLKKENWIEYNDKNKLPIEIKDFFKSYEGEELKIANPDENFNLTDVVQYPNLPFRQLQLLEKKGSIWRMVYIQGGIGESNQFYEFKIQNDSIADIKKGYSFENIKTNDSLEYYIKKGKIVFEKLNFKCKRDCLHHF